MDQINNSIGRRAFLRNSSLASGGLILGFSWLNSCKPKVVAAEEVVALEMPKTWSELNSYIKIGDNGVVTLIAPNPEFGSNVKTSLPMILAEELDIDWEMVIIEQANFHPEKYDRQFTGGSQGIRRGWPGLRVAGATARQMLLTAAAQQWGVAISELTTENGIVYHKASGQEIGYGELAVLAQGIEVPEDVPLKEIKDFKIVGHSKKNVDTKNIVTGKPLFAMDHKEDGMLIAMIAHPPFGKKIKSLDGSTAKSMPGIKDVFTITTLQDDYERNGFDTTTHTELAVVVGNSTWEVMQAKKALQMELENISDSEFVMNGWGGKSTVKVPAGLESSENHLKKMEEMGRKKATVLRKDGNPEKAFAEADKILERTYTAPFLAHNCMEPVNCFANVTADEAVLYAPIQAPEMITGTIAARIGLPAEKIHINLSRMGGGFGQRAYGHHLVEAAAISQKVNAPIKMVYTREDDMTYGIYRPTYTATYRAALDKDNNLIGFHVKGGGIPEHPVAANRFPAGAIDNYLAEGWALESNITIGAFRAPRSNFIAGAEQAFLDELAETMGKDPIDFRLEMLERAITKPVGENNDYEAERYAGVLKLVREKSGWDNSSPSGIFKGVSAYFCHNSYVAQVLELSMDGDMPKMEKVTAAIDCGVVINPDFASNMAEGGIVDGIGNAMFGEMSFKEGVPDHKNFDTYRMIRHTEAPKSIDVHFVESEVDPTGMGEPPFPPVFGAVANALYKATGRRFTKQPFITDKPPLVG
ncbi:xanthine dehydrogenase family protein molybdopterin-binding subunit [Allomuricauda sp. NBRC 101325]|uniref:xanthine dehydrogenase family protein molybdopterin-binding subunit n=1 Tax=Allomuricauda sp. NBRC 101325 TaxID=1113758 RepID=UPI0024A2A5FC|nr:molybdopterin cofactor-binding domain-containing protein [Muricauda sp. NBRC 101325]GLU45144.1 isoquinoline 1-oxidoreductase subunit beta [Muricauda sp. NBRC 101325]